MDKRTFVVCAMALTFMAADFRIAAGPLLSHSHHIAMYADDAIRSPDPGGGPPG
jgi:hypothetical protein